MTEWYAEVGVRSVSCSSFCPIEKNPKQTSWKRKKTSENRSNVVSRFVNGISNCVLRFEYRLHYWEIPDILAYIARFRECPNSHKVAVNGTEGKENV